MGAYSAPTDTLARFNGPLHGRKGRAEKGKGGTENGSSVPSPISGSATAHSCLCIQLLIICGRLWTHGISGGSKNVYVCTSLICTGGHQSQQPPACHPAP